MKEKYKDKVLRVAVMILIAAGFAMNVSAQVIDDEVEIDGVCYQTHFHKYKDYFEVSAWGWQDRMNRWYFLEYETLDFEDSMRELCGASWSWDNSHTYQFCDETFKIPAFEYPAIVVRPKSKANESTDTPARYKGEVWIQDSVPMKALPNLRKTKYHWVCDVYFDDTFDKQELTFIRTPCLMQLLPGVFKDYTGLRTARIGTISFIEEGAFENCERLETVIFEHAPIISNLAFKNCPNIRTVVMEKKCLRNYWYEGSDDYDSYPFDPVVFDNATLYVRADQLDAARQNGFWNKFKNIRDIEEYYAGIGNLTPDAPVSYQIYDLSGVLVRTARPGENWRGGLSSGVYIVKSSTGSVHKEYIK